MGYILQALNQFKQSIGFLWDFIILFIGAVIPSTVIFLKKFYRKIKIRMKLRKVADLEELNVLRICSATPKYRYSDIATNVSERKLYIGFPAELTQHALINDTEFAIHADLSFDGSGSFADIVLRTEIADLKDRIDKHRRIVAEWFINRENGCHFNRPKYGVYEMQYDIRKGNDEIPEVRLEFFETDYFTHRVFRSIYQELKAEGHPIARLTQENLREGLEKYNAFTTSIGINAFVIAESKSGESIIFSRRAGGAAYSENKFKYNSTVMEGISQTDYDSYENKVSLKLAIERALNEELGLSSDHMLKFEQEIHYCDFFLEKNYFEIGMTAMVKIDAIFEESIRDLPAKDKELEISRLVPVPKSKAAIEKFIGKEKLYPQALFTLKMICAREMIFINIKNKSII